MRSGGFGLVGLLDPEGEDVGEDLLLPPDNLDENAGLFVFNDDGFQVIPVDVKIWLMDKFMPDFAKIELQTSENLHVFNRPGLVLWNVTEDDFDPVIAFLEKGAGCHAVFTFDFLLDPVTQHRVNCSVGINAVFTCVLRTVFMTGIGPSINLPKILKKVTKQLNGHVC